MSALHLKTEDGIAMLTLDNPSKLNALTIPMLEALDAHCAVLEQDSDVGVVILCAKGDRAFCVGADINAWADLSPRDFARNWVRTGHRIFNRLAQLPQPTIAVLSGPAFGGGLELATTCDLRVSSPGAILALPETSVGIVPGWSGSQRLADHLPPAILKEMALLGHRLSAERGYQLGYINEIAEDPLACAYGMAKKILSKSSYATEITKCMIQSALGEATSEMVEVLGGGMIASSHDKVEGIQAFREKRKPKFQGN